MNDIYNSDPRSTDTCQKARAHQRASRDQHTTRQNAHWQVLGRLKAAHKGKREPVRPLRPASIIDMAIMMENNPFMSVYGDDAEDDNALEDIGFFTLGKPEADEAQQALNELGLVPSPPRRPGDEHEQGRYGNPDEVGNMPFDLDHELDLEEMDRREEESQPTPYDLEKDDEDERLEGNGLLDEMSSPVRTPPDISGAEASVQASLAHLRDQASASTSKQPAIVSSSVQRPQLVSVLEEEDDNLGINGLPKYIPAGVTHVALLDGSTACLEKRKRVAAWKVSIYRPVRGRMRCLLPISM